jgi:hypothetical protein
MPYVEKNRRGTFIHINPDCKSIPDTADVKILDQSTCEVLLEVTTAKNCSPCKATTIRSNVAAVLHPLHTFLQKLTMEIPSDLTKIEVRTLIYRKGSKTPTLYSEFIYD